MWLSIDYRDFYDVPRVFVVEHAGQTFLFDCSFDEAKDQYRSEFTVYRLKGHPGSGSWEHLKAEAELVGSVPVEGVTFDPTKRSAIDSSAFVAL